MSDSAQAPYERLLALGICELELARDGRLNELASCQAARAELMRSLPSAPPAQALPTLERCLVIERQLETELRNARSAVLGAMQQLRRAQRAADGYTPVRDRLRLINTDA
jgi:hypothetical protein